MVPVPKVMSKSFCFRSSRRPLTVSTFASQLNHRFPINSKYTLMSLSRYPESICSSKTSPRNFYHITTDPLLSSAPTIHLLQSLVACNTFNEFSVKHF
ncbi:hypothetical protein L596_008106 [Steinernema carpocapsae]|uniref:Uncharacterized protein n=1 Tax=Steinernema carpocapsae TaxID=34508 RepID=A0A4U5PBP9_STECR|nr:hypothetical protein L596_008106 [Steinernema carpocapsae]